MFRYKNAKHKSNYIHTKITAGADHIPPDCGTGEPVRLCQGTCTLSFSLFPGDHTAYARYEAGTVGNDSLIGETAVCYKYENGMIRVCNYDYVHQGYYEKQHHDTPPVFRLYRKTENQETDAALQPFLEVSSTKDTAFSCSRNEVWMATAAEKIREQLRTTYMQIIDSLRDAGISLYIHLGDEADQEPDPGIVTGWQIGAVQGYQGYFYNIDSTAQADRRHGRRSWLDYYDHWIGQYFPNNQSHAVPGHTYCSSNGFGLPCSIFNIFFGGHVFCNPNLIGGIPWANNQGQQYLITGLNRQQHAVPGPLVQYHLLPICVRHNNYNYYDMVMFTAQIEDVLILDRYGQ